MNILFNSTTKIPVTDADGDRVKCIWCVGSECGGINNTVSGIILDQDKCTLTFSPGYADKIYAQDSLINIKLNIEFNKSFRRK